MINSEADNIVGGAVEGIGLFLKVLSVLFVVGLGIVLYYIIFSR